FNKNETFIIRLWAFCLFCYENLSKKLIIHKKVVEF
ncbi:hypothetical protein NT05LI_0414, partial [Listeria ivanovii FSL F6-596]